MAVDFEWQVRGIRMTDSVMLSVDAEGEEPRVPTECSGFPLTLQSLIDTLIDIDLAYERRCNEVSKINLGVTLQYHRLKSYG
jgi:hypothetical protein